jgi:flagella basal body P-ring formation protein FlgA
MKPVSFLLFPLLAAWLGLAAIRTPAEEPRSWKWLAAVLDKPAPPNLAAPATLATTSAPHASPVSPVCLKSEASVDSQGIFLDQVVGDNPDLNAPHLRLADAPAWGRTLSLSRSQIAVALRAAPAPWANLGWTGAEAIRISRRTRLLVETEIKEWLRAKLQQESVRTRGDLELRLARPWKPLPVPDESIELRLVDLPETGVAASFLLRFELTAAKESLGSWQQVIQAHVWRDIWTTRSPVKRGTPLNGSDLLQTRFDVLALRDAMVTDPPPDGAVEWVETLPAGAPVYVHSFRPRALVHRGDLIAAMLQDGAMTISLKVEVLEEGGMGQSIRVRNPLSKREFRGKVQNEQSILVAL